LQRKIGHERCASAGRAEAVQLPRSRRTLYGKTDRCCATEADSPRADWADTAEPDSGLAPARLGDQTGHRCRVVAS
jgi:hypothetical protein